LPEVTHETIENYQRVMDGMVVDQVGDYSDDITKWLAKFRQPTHAKPMPARALSAGR
jgi:hypothetical protein